MDEINQYRRKLLTLGAVAFGLTLIPNTLLAAPKTPTKTASKSRTLYVKALNLNETLRSTYFDGEKYVASELKKLNRLFRDRRNDEEIEIDVGVYDQLYLLQNYFGQDKAIMMICGYRSPVTNQNMKATKAGVAEKSLHMTGQAVDFYIEDVPLKKVQEAALALKSGGVGYYPKSNFVHVDTGTVRHWPRSSVTGDIKLMKGPSPLPKSSTGRTTTVIKPTKTSSAKS